MADSTYTDTVFQTDATATVGFYGATPVVQPHSSNEAAVGTNRSANIRLSTPA